MRRGNFANVRPSLPGTYYKLRAGKHTRLVRSLSDDLYQGSYRLTDVSPISHSDGCDACGLGGEFSPCIAGGVDDGVVVFEDGV